MRSKLFYQITLGCVDVNEKHIFMVSLSTNIHSKMISHCYWRGDPDFNKNKNSALKKKQKTNAHLNDYFFH